MYQAIFVSLCVCLALIFMGRKIYNTFKRRGACDCESTCKSRACSGGGICPNQKILQELEPKDK